MIRDMLIALLGLLLLAFTLLIATGLWILHTVWKAEQAARHATYGFDLAEEAEQGIEDIEYFLEEVARNVDGG